MMREEHLENKKGVSELLWFGETRTKPMFENVGREINETTP